MPSAETTLLKDFIVEKFDDLNLIMDVKFENVYARQDEMITHQKETNGKVKRNMSDIMTLEKVSKEYMQDKKTLCKIWKARHVIVLGLMVILFASMSLYNSIDFKRSVKNKFGIEFVDMARDSIQ